jgi:hypothetical protein
MKATLPHIGQVADACLFSPGLPNTPICDVHGIAITSIRYGHFYTQPSVVRTDARRMRVLGAFPLIILRVPSDEQQARCVHSTMLVRALVSRLTVLKGEAGNPDRISYSSKADWYRLEHRTNGEAG